MQQETLTKSMIFLDACTTDSCTKNLDMIKDLKTCISDDTLHLETNSGMKSFDQRGIGTVLEVPIYYNKDSMGTIIVIKDVLNIPGARIIFDSDVEKAMNVFIGDKNCKFSQVADNTINISVSHYCILFTVLKNKECLSD